MAQNETGHEKNFANFKMLNTFILGMGKDYQPTNPLAVLTNVQNIIAKGEPIMQTLRGETSAAYYKAVDVQDEAFNKLPRLLTRVVKAFKAVADTDDEVATAVSLADKIRSSGKEKKGAPATTEATPADTHSTSQRSYDNQVAFFSQLLGVLTTNGKYNPKEANLQLPTLTTFRDELKTKTEAVDPALQAFNKARNNRDQLFYDQKTGMLHVAEKVKDYLASVYQYGSPEMKYINSLKFTYPKKK